MEKVPNDGGFKTTLGGGVCHGVIAKAEVLCNADNPCHLLRGGATRLRKIAAWKSKVFASSSRALLGDRIGHDLKPCWMHRFLFIILACFLVIKSGPEGCTLFSKAYPLN